MLTYILGLLTIPTLSLAIVGAYLAFQAVKRYRLNKLIKEKFNV